MKTLTLMKSILLVMLLAMFVSCKNGGLSSGISGPSGEVLVLMNNALWDGAVGDTVKHWMGQEQVGLPQGEPVFDLLHLPPSMFEKNVKSHRNVLSVEISDKVDSAAVVMKDSPWATGQVYVKIQARDAETFYKLFDANKQNIMALFLKTERERIIDVNRKTPEAAVFNLIKNKFHIMMYCPTGYMVHKDSNNFVWFSMETPRNSRGVIVFERPYVDQKQLQYSAILDTVNAELKRYIPGPAAGSYMAIDTTLTVNPTTYNYNKDYYAVLMKGLWVTEKDFMAGPFVLNVVLDAQQNRLFYMMGYVYAPDENKRNYLRQVEAILFSTDFNMEEPKK